MKNTRKGSGMKKNKILAIITMATCFINYLLFPITVKLPHITNKEKIIDLFKTDIFYRNYIKCRQYTTFDDMEKDKTKEILIEENKVNTTSALNFKTKVEKISASTTKEWFEEYKKIKEEYMYFENDLSISFTSKELNLLYSVVQAEVGDWDFDSKTHVASVIFNRYLQWKCNNLYEVLTEDQFATIKNGSYKKAIIDEETVLACEYAWEHGDTTHNALFFDSTNRKSWASKNREYIFTDKAGHDFYK